MRHTFARSAFVVTAIPCAGLLGGCSGGGPLDGGPLGVAQEASVCAAGATVKGVDVSVFQGTVDWPTAKASGLDFAIARISDGSFLDTEFATNWASIKSAGLVRGAYQFFEPGQNPTTQANIVISAVGKLGAGDLPVTADMEITGGESAATIIANLKTWVAAVQAGTGKAPMIYTAEGYWDADVNSSAFGNLSLWAADWGVTCPTLATGWSDWKFWQDADNGTVSGISGAVDLDEFNGDLAALQTFAGGTADWGAQYVSQSWPLATTTVQMTVNQQLPANITLKNIGAKSWDANTKLATTEPRDRASVFQGPDWLSANRLAAASATAPGADFEFKFTFQAPNTPGAYKEYFGVVQEGVAWFSDPGELGPPDNDIELSVQVNEAEYHGTFVSQTYPTLQQPAITLASGDTMTGTITIKNVGTATWKAGVTKLAPTPRDKASPIGSTGWLSPTRVSSPPTDVATGDSFAFPLEITAGTPGDYTQTFSLVEEGVTWFGDAPLGGGPPDDLIAIHVIVTSPDGGTGASSGGSGGAGGAGAGGSAPDGGIETSSSGGGATTGTGGSTPADGGASASSPTHKSGCSCRIAGDERGDERDDGGAGRGALAALAVAALATRRRRAIIPRAARARAR